MKYSIVVAATASEAAPLVSHDDLVLASRH
jgi:hypothetical protein